MGNKSSGWNLQAMFKETWGNRMSASDWTLAQDGINLAFRRGFTGHEHYDRFGMKTLDTDWESWPI